MPTNDRLCINCDRPASEHMEHGCRFSPKDFTPDDLRLLRDLLNERLTFIERSMAGKLQRNPEADSGQWWKDREKHRQRVITLLRKVARSRRIMNEESNGLSQEHPADQQH